MFSENFINIYSVGRETHKVQVCHFGAEWSLWGRGTSPGDESMKMWIFILRAVLRQRTGSGCIRWWIFEEKMCQRLTRIPSWWYIIDDAPKAAGGLNISMWSVPEGTGTAEDFQTVVLLLPMRIWMAAAAVKMEAILEPGGTASGRKLLIVVNDRRIGKRLPWEHLENMVEVITAMNDRGDEASVWNYKTLSAILLDMSVPVCDEFQFLELIRDDVMLTSCLWSS